MTSLLTSTRRNRAISLTPLIDVVFILLMFFMLTSSFIREHQIELSAPVASQTDTVTPPRFLLLNPMGEFLAQDTLRPVNGVELSGLDGTVVIRPEENTQVQTIVSALNALQSLGISQLTLGAPYPGSPQDDTNFPAE